jgi:hypothetical protein
MRVDVLMRWVFLHGLLALTCFAQQQPQTTIGPLGLSSSPDTFRPGWLVRSSQIALVAGRVVDVASTPWGRPGTELNPLLRSSDGSYGGRGLAIQAAMTGGWLVGQELILRRWGHRRWVRRSVTAVNFSGASVGAGVAVHNHGQRRR